MKNYIKLLVTVVIAGTINAFAVTSFVNDTNISVKSINLLSYDATNEKITVEVNKKFFINLILIVMQFLLAKLLVVKEKGKNVF